MTNNRIRGVLIALLILIGVALFIAISFAPAP